MFLKCGYVCKNNVFGFVCQDFRGAESVCLLLYSNNLNDFQLNEASMNTVVSKKPTLIRVVILF